MTDDPRAIVERRITFIQCGQSCDHDFYGPGSFEHDLDGGVGTERVCRCGLGAMAYTLIRDRS